MAHVKIPELNRHLSYPIVSYPIPSYPMVSYGKNIEQNEEFPSMPRLIARPGTHQNVAHIGFNQQERGVKPTIF